MLQWSYALLRAVIGYVEGVPSLNYGLIWAALGVSSLNMLVQTIFSIGFGVRRVRLRGVK